MMTDETFAEFEARMKSEGASGSTNTNPALEERDGAEDDEGDDALQ